ncbi:MAG: 5-methylthioadenosine/S-adenosylhomocysteine deaminase [Polyangiales bacterium]
MTKKTLLIQGGTLVTMDGTRRVFKGDVLVRDGRIAALRGPGEARLVAPRGTTKIDAKGMLVLPGLIQAHVHLCQALFRNMADDLPLLPWLKERIWPFEAAHDMASLKASAELGLAEMMLAGTTTILDMGTVHHQDAIFRAMKRSGIRGISGKAMMDVGADVPKGLRESTRASLRNSIELAERWHQSADGRLEYAFAPRFILSCSEKLWRKVAKAAEERGLRIHSHIAEHAEERKAVKKILGMDDVAALFEYGVAGPHVILAHGVQLRKTEMRRLAKAGTRIVHCPSANLKLASGIADVAGMREAGIVVAIGADGAPCNNRMDPWTELRSAALLAKVRRDDAANLPAREALELATIDGARALGLDDEVGSIEVGKKADVIIVGRDGLHQGPGDDPYSQLVYATQPSDVRDVVIDGEVIVRDGTHLRFKRESVMRAARREAKKVAARAF